MRRARLSTLQLNLGRFCNLACTHCHVEAGPKRKETMSAEVRARVIDWIALFRPRTVDLTGGAPELIEGFRELVDASRAAGCRVLDRCNLAVLDERGQEDLASFLAARQVEVVASLPCYSPENVDRQRGKGTFDRSIRGLRALNAEGYGRRPDLPLHLVFNPTGPSLPPDQRSLERDYRARLKADFDIDFTDLWCLANVPIRRFARHLERQGQAEAYENLLRSAYNEATLDGLMCRTTLSVDHEGLVYDCDFHLAMDIPIGGGSRRRIWDIDPASLEGDAVPMGPHCLACTAGAGSSCTGAVVDRE
ncbi:MAG: arsenosugar biosynthesis radical SAM protein ArsS [Planctomycetota bacterium]